MRFDQRLETEIEGLESMARWHLNAAEALRNIDVIVGFAAQTFNLDTKAVWGSRRTIPIITARHLVWAILSAKGVQSASIARAWGLHETTIHNGIKSVRKKYPGLIQKGAGLAFPEWHFQHGEYLAINSEGEVVKHLPPDGKLFTPTHPMKGAWE